MSPISALYEFVVTYWQQQHGSVVQVQRAAVGSNISTAKLTFSALFGMDAGSAETRVCITGFLLFEWCVMTRMSSQ